MNLENNTFDKYWILQCEISPFSIQKRKSYQSKSSKGLPYFLTTALCKCVNQYFIAKKKQTCYSNEFGDKYWFLQKKKKKITFSF